MSDCSDKLINYMTTNIESVKLSRDSIIIQHFRLCNLFNKHVFCYFSTVTRRIVLKSAIYIYYVDVSIDRPSQNSPLELKKSAV